VYLVFVFSTVSSFLIKENATFFKSLQEVSFCKKLYDRNMISKLRGKVDEIGIGKIILDVNGVGYLLNVTNDCLQNIKTGENIVLHTHLAVRENSMDLYGFQTSEEMDFYELLLGVSGVGPKSAIGILNSASIQTIKEGIASGDPSHLTKVSGLGKKSAEKIMVALKDKIGSLDEYDTQNLEGGGMAIEALAALGYSDREAREVVSKIDRSLPTEEIVKQALKELGNGNGK
jgi:Holliday junction DNA helicase RuvA